MKKKLILTQLKIFYSAAKRFYMGDYSYNASALAFITLLAIVPLFAVFLYLFSFLPIFTDAMQFSHEYILSHFVPSSQSVLQNYLHQFIKNASNLPIISIIFSIISSVLVIRTIGRAINSIFHTLSYRRPFANIMVVWIFLLFIPFFVGVGVTTSELIAGLFLSDLAYLGVSFFNFLILGGIFSILYMIAIKKSLPWKMYLLGGFTVAVLLELSRLLFTYYIQFFTEYEMVYGAFGIIPIFLIWLYLIWTIILYGALVIFFKSEAS